jgi:hypothetical protein
MYFDAEPGHRVDRRRPGLPREFADRSPGAEQSTADSDRAPSSRRVRRGHGPKSPFDGVRTEAPRVTPPGRLQLVSDALNQDGTRTAYYSAHASGTATISSTVMIQSDLAVPEWVGVVIVT